MIIPTITISVPTLHLFIRVHNNRPANTREVKVEMSDTIRRKYQNITLLQLQDQTNLMQNYLTTIELTKWYDNTYCVIVDIHMTICAHLDIKNETREGICCRMLIER